MKSIGELVKVSSQFLSHKKIDEPRLNAELLLAAVLNITRMDLYLDLSRPVQDRELATFRDYIRRRIKGEPLQYILESQYFYGLELFVSPDVFIPRPETELLVETVVNKLDNPRLIMEIGVGSGAISVALLKHFKSLKIVAVDISKKAIDIAKRNAEKFGVRSSISFCHEDILDKPLSHIATSVDAIVSNPPYIPQNEKESLKTEVKDHEPSIALFVENGMEFYEKIVGDAKYVLRPQGDIFFEIHADARKKMSQLLVKNNFENVEVLKDLQNHPRVAYGKKSSLVLHKTK